MMSSKFFALGAAGLMIIVVGGTVAWTFWRGGGVCGSDRQFVRTLPKGLLLTDINGTERPVFDQMQNPALVYFGYSFCPDVCPFDMARNDAVTDALEGRITPVFVTVDPARDTLAVLAEYASFHHTDMIALTGTDAQIKAASDAFAVYYQPLGDDAEYYLMDHSTLTYLLLPSGEIVEFFYNDLTSDVIEQKIACLLGHYQQTGT
ncbi:MAG: SCO family protein [Planktomarina sp.]